MCAFIGTLNTYVLLCTYKTTMVMKPSNFDANRLQVSHFFYAKLAYQLEFSSNYSQCIRPNKQCVQNVFEGAHPYPNALEFSPTYHTDLWGIYANVKIFFWPSQL